MLLTELVDELAGGVREAAWPLVRRDLGLSYIQIGVLLAAPALISGLLDPVFGVAADGSRRRLLVIVGGISFGASLFLTASSPCFWLLLFSFVVFSTASGAFVNTSQAELMDREPGRGERNMARWTFAGSAGALAGPLALGAASACGIGWRGVFLAVGAASLGTLALALRTGFPARGKVSQDPPASGALHRGSVVFREGVLRVVQALKMKEVLRWLLLLEIANLMLDVLFGFLSLYFVEVASVTIGQAAVAVTAWTAAGVLGDLLVIPLLKRVSGIRYLRFSAAITGVLYPGFLLAGPLPVKLALLSAIGLLRAGWYAILQARLYASLPGRSGLAVAAGSIAGSAGALIPLGLGALAEVAGLRVAMWLLLAAPVALLVGLPRLQERSASPARRRHS